MRAIAALSIAGLPTERFAFEGFLPARAAARRRRLAALAPKRARWFSTRRRIDSQESLEDLAQSFGGERAAAVAREITKHFETVYRGTLASLARARGAATPTCRAAKS